MKKTIIIICSVGALGLLRYELHQNTRPAGWVTPKQSATTQTNSKSTSSSSNPNASGTYKDGTFTGAASDNPYGTVQIAVIITRGKISNVNFLQMPGGSGHTDEVTTAASPLLKQTTIQNQSSNIDFVSGATLTSESYQQSLQSALDQAKI